MAADLRTEEHKKCYTVYVKILEVPGNSECFHITATRICKHEQCQFVIDFPLLDIFEEPVEVNYSKLRFVVFSIMQRHIPLGYKFRSNYLNKCFQCKLNDLDILTPKEDSDLDGLGFRFAGLDTTSKDEGDY